ncbi:MAG: NAD-dependent epimerase/dehydratase family protein [Treponemataceae bacterium]|nr:NAD-dependent epimerase/dehydratase family protein [Treponemataceae bacterium]
MKILVIGGTRFFGIHMVRELLARRHDVTIATRGKSSDEYGDSVRRIVVDRTDEAGMKNAFRGLRYDVAIDNIAYCSNDIRRTMEAVTCEKYIFMSSTAVYEPKHIDTVESDFDGAGKKLVWCERKDFPYDEAKRQAERALWQKYSDRNWIAARYPFVIGKDDYTKRLLWYVEHTVKSVPMSIDNLDCQMGFVHSDEAGKFLAFLADKNIKGAFNGSAQGTISIREIISYVEKKTGTNAVIKESGERAPYNGEPEYSINTEKAKALGFRFSTLRDWIYELLDFYIQEVGGF